MYEDFGYNFLPEFQQQRGDSQQSGYRTKDSLLQHPNEVIDVNESVEPFHNLYEAQEKKPSLHEAVLARRAKSYSDFYDIVQAQIAKHGPKEKRKRLRKASNWEALGLETRIASSDSEVEDDESIQDQLLLEASQQDYLLYHDQLAMTERHLESLVRDTDDALELLASLAKSFQSVQEQTSFFQAQCEDILAEQKRLQTLADDVGSDLNYYLYLDNVTRRLNAPGAGRLADDEALTDTLNHLDSCMAFMAAHSSYRDSDSYLARYQALLIKALHLLEVGFTSRLVKVSADVTKQIAATQSESARHALAYGRFEELLMDSCYLIPNLKRVVFSAYDKVGNPKDSETFDIYANTANTIFQRYLSVRERDLKPIIQHDLDTFKTESMNASIEKAVRSFVKQSLERSFDEAELFAKIFSIELHFSTDPRSVFASLRSVPRSLVNGINVAPMASILQTTLQSTDLQTVCNILGWMTNEYLDIEYDEDDLPFTRHCRELMVRLLAEHLWAFTDALFEAEITKKIARPPVVPENLQIGPVTNGVASLSAYLPIKQALELLVLFDQSMPKERCQRNSPVVYKIVKESIAALHRAEARIKTTKPVGVDPDLFMIKNLLMLKNELISLEIGDVRNGDGVSGGLAPGAMQHFSQIWDALTPQGLLGLLSSIGSYIPLPALPSAASSLWGTGPSSRSETRAPPSGGVASVSSRVGALVRGKSSNNAVATSSKGGAAVTGAMLSSTGVAALVDGQDASEHMDELLRQNIYAFTHRWAGILIEARGFLASGPKLAGRNLVKIERELNEMLDRAFSNQPEVVAKLKEAIEINIQTQQQRGRQKQGRGSHLSYASRGTGL